MSWRSLIDHAEWTADANCHGRGDLMFAPSLERPPAQERRVAAAKEICRRCDVQAECLTYALNTNQTHGIWGGHDEIELRRLRRRLLRQHRLEEAQ